MKKCELKYEMTNEERESFKELETLIAEGTVEGFECTGCALEAKEISRDDVERMYLCSDCTVYVGNMMFWFGAD